MRLIAIIPGLALILIILWDAFETIILPRRVTRRLRFTSIFYKTMWTICAGMVRAMHNRKRREKYLGTFGPLSLLMLLAMWAAGLILGYAILLWAMNTPLSVLGSKTNFGTYIYLSGVTFFTLGYGDVVPVLGAGRALVVIEAATGFGLLAIVIGYLPVLYQAFSRREVNIAKLDARAGSPSSAAEMLRRHGESGHMNDLNRTLHEWEHWAAELLESHLSYPVLCYFRSQHDNESWLSAITTILDTCALMTVGVDDLCRRQAQLTFAIARHALSDLAQVLGASPRPGPERLPSSAVAELRATLARHGVRLGEGESVNRKLAELRRLYEPYVNSLATRLLLAVPSWIEPNRRPDNWSRTAWDPRPPPDGTLPLFDS